MVDGDQESSRVMCPAFTDGADSCSEGVAADEIHVLRQSLGLGADPGFPPFMLLLNFASLVRFCSWKNAPLLT